MTRRKSHRAHRTARPPLDAREQRRQRGLPVLPSLGDVGQWWRENVAIVKQPGRRYGPAPLRVRYAR